jgi:chaperonin cofactor prefoldin
MPNPVREKEKVPDIAENNFVNRMAPALRQALKDDFENLDTQLKGVGTQLTGLDSRLESMDSRLESMDSRLQSIERSSKSTAESLDFIREGLKVFLESKRSAEPGNAA